MEAGFVMFSRMVVFDDRLIDQFLTDIREFSIKITQASPSQGSVQHINCHFRTPYFATIKYAILVYIPLLILFNRIIDK